MRFVLDEDLSRSTGEALRLLGHAVLDIRDVGLRGSSDEVVFHFAQKRRAVIVTADLGFSNILRFPQRLHAGVIVLRFPNEMSTGHINTLVRSALTLLRGQDLTATIVVMSPKGIRMRKI